MNAPDNLAEQSTTDLVAAMNEAHDQMTAAWSYYIEAKAAFSIAAGELALAQHRSHK